MERERLGEVVDAAQQPKLDVPLTPSSPLVEICVHGVCLS